MSSSQQQRYILNLTVWPLSHLLTVYRSVLQFELQKQITVGPYTIELYAGDLMPKRSKQKKDVVFMSFVQEVDVTLLNKAISVSEK